MSKVTLKQVSPEAADIIARELIECINKITTRLVEDKVDFSEYNLVSTLVSLMLMSIRDVTAPEDFVEYVATLYTEYTKDVVKH
jgi:hypothetical protein